MVRPPDAHEPPATGGPGRESQPSGPHERVRSVWRALPRERRLAVLAALGLMLTLFLPWYQETVIAQGTSSNLSTLSASLTGWGAFSFVEAAVLLVAAAVIVLLFVRAEGAAFHVPGGDGGVVTAAGLWACLLIVWRMFDKQGTTGHGLYETASGIEWGIFIALAVAALLTYAGSRIKLAHEPEPPLPGEGAEPPRTPRRARAEARSAPAESPPPLRSDTVSPTGDLSPPRRRRVRPSSLADPPTELERRPHRGLDVSELEQITLDDPPEAPTIRRREPAPDDPLTARLDRPD